MMLTIHRSPWRLALAAALLLAGLGLAFQPLAGNIQERSAQSRLATEAAATEAPSPAPAAEAAAAASGAQTPAAAQEPAGTAAKSGAAAASPAGPPLFAHLSIPAIGLQVYVVDGATLTAYQRLLDDGPAHLKGSAGLGAVGNVVIFGHRDEYGSPFWYLYRLVPGDLVTLAAGGRSVTYRVTASRAVEPSDLSVLSPTGARRELTLITCTGPGNALRLAVRAVAA